MKGSVLSAAATAIILAVSPMQSAHAAAGVLGSQATADLDASQTGKSSEATEPRQNNSAESKSTHAKALRRAYAVRARIAKQKAQLAKTRKQKQPAKLKKRFLKATKTQAA